MDIKTGIKNVVTEMLLLALLKNEDMYGYRLCRELEKLGGSTLTIQEGTIYPILYRMKKNGFITSYKKKVGKKRTRVYYQIQTKGNLYLEQMKSEYVLIQKAIQNILMIA